MKSWMYAVIALSIFVVCILLIVLIVKKNNKNVIENKEIKDNKNDNQAINKVDEEISVENHEIEQTKKQYIGKFAVSFDPTDNNYRYRLYASNGESLVVSEIYSSLDGAKKGIETLKSNAKRENIEVVEDKHGLFSFRVLSLVGSRCLATSANYQSKQQIESTIESFLKNVVTDKIVENEKDDHDEAEEFKDVIEPIEGGKVRVFKEKGEYFYQLIANNGRVIANSQGYSSKSYALESLERMRELVYTGKFFIFKDKKSNYQFKLYNDSMRMMMAGEIYDSKTKVNNVITSLKRFYRMAVVEEDL